MLPATHAAPKSATYRTRKPQTTAFYQCVEDHFETLEQVYDERFARQYGFFRPYVRDVIYRFLDCGILQNGFAESDAIHAATSTFCPFHASAGTSAPPATRSAWSSSASGSSRRSSRPFPTATGSSASRRYFAGMTYLPREARVIYESRDGERTKTFDALEWLAAMLCSHVPNKGEQMVRYYGYDSNVCRGKRKARGEDEALPTVLHPDEGSSAPSRKEWAQ